METITIYTAGRSQGDPGPAAVGVYVVDVDGKVIFEHKESIGNATDSFAEYQAVASALDVVQVEFGAKTKDMQFDLKLCSEIVKMQINGEDKVEDPRTISHFIYIHNQQVEHYPNLSFTLVKPEQNIEATRLVGEALDGK